MNPLQSIFKRVTDHLLQQNAKSLNHDGDCMYRGADGRMCAVGCLIADEHYSPGLESQLSSEPDVQKALEASGIEIDEHSVKLLRELQIIHDVYDLEKWPHYLQALARKRQLVYETS